MADFEEGDFSSADAGASDTFPQQCSALRKNGHVVIKARPCKIVEMSTSKTGKHGHAKVWTTSLEEFIVFLFLIVIFFCFSLWLQWQLSLPLLKISLYYWRFDS